MASDSLPPDERLYTPIPGEAQLTIRAIVAGCLVGAVVACTNIYIGLKIGWSFGASIIAAVLSFALFAAGGRKLSVLETNTAQTAGSAAGYMASAAGLLAPIPAMQMLGYEFAWQTLILWAVAVAFLGVFFAVPLRRQMVLVERLRFPSGTATAETIVAMASESTEALSKAKALMLAAIVAGLFSLSAHFFPLLKELPLAEWVGVESWLGTWLVGAAAWGFSLKFGPALFGAGFLMGPRVVVSLFAGALLGWALIGPYVQSAGWAPGAPLDYAKGPRGWILWPGVALMVSEALMSLALSWQTFVRAFMPQRAGNVADPHANEAIPATWWMGGLALGSLATVTIAQAAFAIPWYLTIVAIALSSVLAAVAVRSSGETDINPVGGMGKVTQLVFGGLAPGQMGMNLMAAAITGGGASQASDMMQDLKAGHLLGAAPRKQFIAQLCGIVAGVVFVVPVYWLFSNTSEIGVDPEFPAPAAHAWKAMAEVMAEGFGALPPHADVAALVAICLGVGFPLLRRRAAFRPFVPSGLAVGIGMIVAAHDSMIMFLGLGVWLIWRRISPLSAERLTYSVAAGLIAGEGLAGICNAALTIAGIGPH